MRRRSIAVWLVLAMAFLAPAFSAAADGLYELTLSPSGTLSMDPGDTKTVSVSVEPVNLIEHVVTWSSDNEYVASVDAKGKITARAAGSTRIVATIETGDSASVRVTVSGRPVTSIALSESEIELELGSEHTLTHTVNSDADDLRVRWSSDDETVATVDGKGTVKAVGCGTAVITVMAVNGKTASASVYVPSDVQSILLYPETLLLPPGERETLDAYVFPGNARGRELTWESSNVSVAHVGQSGVVTALSEGECIVRAYTANGVSAEVKVTVANVPTKLAVSRTFVVLSRQNRTCRLTCEIEPAAAAGCALTWESSDPKIVKVENGLLTAMNYGRATVTVTAPGGLTAAAEVYVCDPPSSVAFARESYAVQAEGAPVETELVFEPAGSMENVTYRVADTGIAAVDENGAVTGLASGSTLLIVECESGLSASVPVRVTEETRAISFAEGEQALFVGQSAQLTVLAQTGEPAEDALLWTSADETVVSVFDGLLFARKPGQTTVTARNESGTLSCTCEVTVTLNPNVTPKNVALTFDNGPGAYTEDILSVLEMYDVRATFFLLGTSVKESPRTAALLRDTKHEIGNHTYRNASLNTSSFTDIATDIERADQLILSATGRAATVLRAPDANLPVKLFTTFLDTRRFVGWSVDSGDARRDATADGICETVLGECFDTAILVFHDSGSETAAALRRIIPALAEQGYQFVTVSELIEITGNTNAVFTTKR